MYKLFFDCESRFGTVSSFYRLLPNRKCPSLLSTYGPVCSWVTGFHLYEKQLNHKSHKNAWNIYIKKALTLREPSCKIQFSTIRWRTLLRLNLSFKQKKGCQKYNWKFSLLQCIYWTSGQSYNTYACLIFGVIGYEIRTSNEKLDTWMNCSTQNWRRWNDYRP